MTNYWELPGFEHIYLEDSWVLSIKTSESTLRIAVDFVLRESHPQYRTPRPGEQYCYRRGRIQFGDVTALSWIGEGAAPATDATGEHDLSSFDLFEVVGDEYTIAGDFGRVELVASLPRVEFLE